MGSPRCKGRRPRSASAAARGPGGRVRGREKPSSSPLLDRPHGDPEPGRPEHGVQAAKFRIARLGEHLVGRLASELRSARDLGDAALRLRDLAQREHERRLVAILDHGLEVRRGFGGVLELLDEPGLVRQASGGRAAFSAQCAPCSPRSTLSHGQCPFAASSCLLRKGAEPPPVRAGRDRRGIPAPNRS